MSYHMTGVRTGGGTGLPSARTPHSEQELVLPHGFDDSDGTGDSGAADTTASVYDVGPILRVHGEQI